MLTQTTIRKLFDYDHDRLIRKPSRNTNGYSLFKIGRKKYREHRLVWIYHHGPVPKDMHIHHINGRKGDNRIENLECVTATEHRKLRWPRVLSPIVINGRNIGWADDWIWEMANIKQKDEANA